MGDNPTNPYISMDDKQLTEHLTLLNGVVKDSKTIDVPTLLGIEVKPDKTITDRLDKFGTLLGEIQTKVMSPGTADAVPDPNVDKPTVTISDNEKTLAKQMLATTTSAVKAKDEKIPLESITSSSLSDLDKISTLQALTPIIDYYNTTITALKTQIPDAVTKNEDKFSKPKSVQTDWVTKFQADLLKPEMYK